MTVGLVHPNAVRSAFAQLTGLPTKDAFETKTGNFIIQLEYYGYEENKKIRQVTVSMTEAMFMVGQAMKLESLEKNKEMV